MTSRHKTEYVRLPHTETSRFLELVKCDLGLETLGVYNILSKCGWVCTAQTAGLLSTREREHHKRIHLGQLDKLAEVKDRFNHEHEIQIHGTKFLSIES